MIESVEMTIRQPGQPDRVVRLREGTTQLGRAEDNDVVLADVGVSRRHSRIVVTREVVRIEDGGSGNGTYYRGARIDQQNLIDGDEVIIDPFVLRFRIKGSRPEQNADVAETGARLDVIAGASMTRGSYPIGARGATLGRSETRDIVVPDPASSRHHATIFPQEGRWLLRDMGSANGIYVNGARVREVILGDGDRIRIGNTEFRFVVGDSTRAGSTTPTGHGWADMDSPNLRDSYTGAAPRARSSSLAASLFPVAFGGLVALVVLFGVVAVGGVLLYVLLGPPGGRAPGAPPRYTLNLPAGEAETQVDLLFEQGIAAMNGPDKRAALEAFYRALLVDNGNPSGERLAFLVGEIVVLDAMGPVFETNRKARLEREALRDKLLKDAPRNAKARDQLEREFRDDPLVREQRKLVPSEEEQKLQEQLALAAEHMKARKPLDALRAYEAVLKANPEPTVRRSAEAGLGVARAELAQTTARAWRAGITAELAGDNAAAKAAYAEVLAMDPDNASARIRTKRLEGT